MTTPTPTTPSPAVATQNSGSSEQNDSLSAAISEAEAKVRDAEKWDRRAGKTLNVLALLYVLITAAVTFSSVWSNRMSGNLRSAEKLLNDLQKEKIRAESLLRTAVETQRVREEAATELKLKTEEVRGEAAANIERARGEAETKIAEANERTQKIGLQVAQQQERAAKAERKLEAERLERIRLEAEIATPSIVNTLVMMDALKPFAGTKVILEYADEEVPRSFARELEEIFGMARWEVSQKTPRRDVRPNVEVMGAVPAREGDRSAEAAETLVRQLRANDIEVWGRPTTTLPPNTVKVVVGRFESTYLAERRYDQLFRDFVIADARKPVITPIADKARLSEFTEKQQNLFVDVLSNSPKAPLPVEVRCPADNAEASTLAHEIGLLLMRAEWMVLNNSVMQDREYPSWTGERHFPLENTSVSVIARWSTQEQFLTAVPITEACQAAGISVQFFRDFFDRSAPILVMVTSKRN